MKDENTNEEKISNKVLGILKKNEERKLMEKEEYLKKEMKILKRENIIRKEIMEKRSNLRIMSNEDQNPKNTQPPVIEEFFRHNPEHYSNFNFNNRWIKTFEKNFENKRKFDRFLILF